MMSYSPYRPGSPCIPGPTTPGRSFYRQRQWGERWSPWRSGRCPSSPVSQTSWNQELCRFQNRSAGKQKVRDESLESFSHTYTKRTSIFKRRKCRLNIMMRSNGKVLLSSQYWSLFLTSRPVLSGQIHVIGALQAKMEIHSSHADLLLQSCCALIKVCHIKIDSVAMWARAKPNFLHLTVRFQLTWGGNKRNI